MSLNILAYGVNGAQMASGTQALVDAGHRVRALTRSEAGTKRWKAAGVETVVADMGDAASLQRATEGQDALFLHVPIVRGLEDDGAAFGLNAINAAKAAGVNRIVWNTGTPIMDPTSETDPNAIILRALQDGGFSFLALSPVLYMENLLGPWTTGKLGDDKLAYPTPVDFKVSWVAAADFGRIADKALQGDLPNEVLTLGGPTSLDGRELATAIGGVLDRSLEFETVGAADFESQLAPFTGPHVAGMVAGMYGAIQGSPEQLQPRFQIDGSVIQTRFGLKLTSLTDWTKQHQGYLAQQK